MSNSKMDSDSNSNRHFPLLSCRKILEINFEGTIFEKMFLHNVWILLPCWATGTCYDGLISENDDVHFFIMLF